VEDVRPDYRAAHILAHQILALVLQEGGGVSRHRIAHWLQGSSAFRDLSDATLPAVVETMLTGDILYESEGLLSLGSEGERRYGRRNFMELYAVFDTPSMLRILHGGAEVGVVQSSFILSLFDKDEPPTFRLAGRAWQLTETDLRRGVAYVKAVEAGKVPTWLGSPSHLSYELCQEQRRTLLDDQRHPWLSGRARAELEALREGYRPILSKGAAPVEVDPEEGTTWHTFAGGGANTLLVDALRRTTRRRWTMGNLSVRSGETTSPADASRFVSELTGIDWPEEARKTNRREGDSISKFEICLPETLRADLFIARRLDVPNAARIADGRSPADRTDRVSKK
jgi:ATP-dependent Lhr-like helicase